MGSAAVIIIGNEILSGKIRDANSPWLALRCRELGIDLERILVIPDDVGTIADAVRQLAGTVDTLITSGGVGPTHDDMTMAGVARAFDVPLVRHPDLEATLRTRMGERFSDAALRMAEVPAGAELWWDGEYSFPLVVMHNVCVFPGVPQLMRGKFDAVAHRLVCGTTVQTRRLVAETHEVAIAAALQQIQGRHPTVEIGSYPQFGARPWTVVLTLDSRDCEALDAAEQDLRAALGTVIRPEG